MKKKFLPLLLVGVWFSIFSLISPPESHAKEVELSSITFCIKKSGAVFIQGSGLGKIYCRHGDKIIIINSDGSGTQGTIGPKGDKGDMGPQGIPGLNGIDGKDGQDGADGAPGLQGVQGEKGEKGDKGDDGAPGSNGASGWERVVQEGPVVTTATEQIVSVTCSEGKKVIGGGYFISSSTQVWYTLFNYPSSENTWSTHVRRSSGSSEWSLNVYAICVTAE